jgi:hypothetical protein
MRAFRDYAACILSRPDPVFQLFEVVDSNDQHIRAAIQLRQSLLSLQGFGD